MASTSGSDSSCSVDWDLCCLCQLDTKEHLQTPTIEGFESLVRDLKKYSGLGNVLLSAINVEIEQLSDGPTSIVATLMSHNAKYHKRCRSYCSKQVKKARKHEDHVALSLVSPKRLRSSHPRVCGIHCVICEGEDIDDLHKAVTDNIDSNLKCWAESSKDFQLLGRLVTQASDVHAAGVYYHRKCYLKLRYAAQQQGETCKWGETFDPITIAQIVALVENSNASYTITHLRQLYINLREDRGYVCSYYEPHTTKFKKHLLNLLPDWSGYQKGRETYCTSQESNKSQTE